MPKKAERKEKRLLVMGGRIGGHSRAGSGGDPLHGLRAEVRRRVAHGGGPPALARLAGAQRLQWQRRASPAQMRVTNGRLDQ